MIEGFPLSFFFPLVVHALAALTTGVTGVLTFRRPKRRGRHPNGECAISGPTPWCFSRRSFSRSSTWPTDAYLVVLATIGYGLALGGYGARRFRQKPM